MIYFFEDYSLDVGRRELRRGIDLVAVEPQVFDILEYVVRNRERVVSKDDLIANVWNGRIVSESTLTSSINAVRRALSDTGEHQRLIRTLSRKGHRFVGEVREQPDSARMSGAKPSPQKEPDQAVFPAAPRIPALPLPDKPSIAVLPFVNVSGDPEQEYFSDGITEDLITALSRFRWFFVIGRNSSFVYKGKAVDAKQIGRELGVRYLLEGSVRKSGIRVRITAQLVDASNANHIWADHYDLDLTDIFAAQDEITERVVGAIEPEMLKIESERASISPESLSNWDLVRQGMWHFNQISPPNHFRAREIFRTAIKRDPELPQAYAWLGRVNAGMVLFGWSDDPVADLREGTEAALKAVQLDEKNPYAYMGLAGASLFGGVLGQSVRAAEKAIEISPSFALGYVILGTATLFSGKPTEAIQPLERGLRLSPFDPQNFIWLRMLALAYYFSGQTELAFQTALRALKVRPSYRPTLETVVICCVALGRLGEARDFVEQMRQLERPSADWLVQLKAHNPQWAEHMEEMIRKAELPEK